MIERDRIDGVTVVRLAHGPVNALDLELLNAITATFDELATEDDGPVVLTGAGRAFSAGVDLRSILDGGAAYVERFLPALSAAFLATFTVPRPVVAAVNGHAIAGGCILACAADRRVAAAGAGRIGVTEMAVGVPFPPAALEILRLAAGARTTDLVLGAELHAPAAAQALGMIDRVVDPDELLGVAVAEATRLGEIPPRTFRQTKSQLQRPALAAIGNATDEDAATLATWRSDEGLAAIGAFADRTLGGTR